MSTSESGPEAVLEALRRTRKAARALRASPAAKRNRALEIAAGLLKERAPEILTANAAEVRQAEGLSRVTPAFLDRLRLDSRRLEQMGTSLDQVRALSDPVGEVVDERRLPNGVLCRRVRAPLGVIYLIFESRPNVALEAFSLALKSGNAMVLRGGRESMATTGVLYDILKVALREAGLPEECLLGITDPDRGLSELLLQQNTLIDVVVPRGGDALIEFVTRVSRIPIIKNDRGLCHVYVHLDADLGMAERIIVNAKTQRPGVCNSMETLLVHCARGKELLRRLYPLLTDEAKPNPVEWHGCKETLSVLAGKPRVVAATDSSWDTEYLDFKLNCRMVDSFDQALEHIERHGSRHSEAIVTSSEGAARRFQGEVDAAAVYWNASTRFTDGFELGLGGELGISTQKLHVRGPVGLRELTSVRWVMDGQGQVRES